MPDSTQASAWRSLVGLAGQLAVDFRNEDRPHQIVGLYVRGRRVLGYGVNQQRYAKLTSYFYDSLHAEADLIRRYGDRLAGSKIFLYRFNNAPNSPVANQPLCARPCPLCSHMLSVVGVSRVVYITDSGSIESMRRSELPMLRENPVVLTKLFLDGSTGQSQGKFLVNRHLA